MSEQCVVAVFDELEHAQEAVHMLDRGEFPTGQVSLVTRGLGEQPELLEDFQTGDDSGRTVALGAGLGAIMGLLSGITVMVVSGWGLVFLAGPIGAGLTGAVAGAVLGGIAGWGVQEERIRHYEKLVQEGKVLVIAHGNALELVHAERILKEADPVELHEYSKNSSESPEIQDV